jgi:hypothetical protein
VVAFSEDINLIDVSKNIEVKDLKVSDLKVSEDKLHLPYVIWSRGCGAKENKKVQKRSPWRTPVEEMV